MQGTENVCCWPNIFVLREIKAMASLLYLQTLKEWDVWYSLKSKNQNCTVRDPYVMFSSKVLRFKRHWKRLWPNSFIVLWEIKTTDYLQNLKIIRYSIYSEKQESKLLRDLYVMFNSRVLRFAYVWCQIYSRLGLFINVLNRKVRFSHFACIFSM